LLNHKFYTDALEPKLKKINFNVNNVYELSLESYSLISSTPSICFLDTNLYVNVRYISYTIDLQGNYINKDKIITVNKMMVFNYDSINNKICNINHGEFIVKYDNKYDDYYIGLEDIRLFNYNNELWFNANRMVNGKLCIEHGKIDLLNECVISTFLDYAGATGNTEKNWITFVKNNEKYQIYKWHPITICSYPPTPQTPPPSTTPTKI
jgi:hypothetical protein